MTRCTGLFLMLITLLAGCDERAQRKPTLTQKTTGAGVTRTAPLTTTARGALPPEQFSFVVTRKGMTGLIIASDGDARPKGSTVVADFREVTMWEDAAVAKRTAAQRAWVGKKVALYGPRGEVCRGVVDGLVWRFNYTLPEDHDALYPKGSAKNDGEFWTNVHEHQAHLVARVKATGCAGAVWGRVIIAGAQAPVIYTPASADAKTTTAGRALFKGLPASTRVASAFAKKVPSAKVPWYRHTDDPDEAKGFDRREVKRFTAPGAGGAKLLFVGAEHEELRCDNDFHGALWALVQESSDAKRPGPIAAVEGASAYIRPLSVADVDGDGAVEVIGKTRMARSIGGVWKLARSVDALVPSCPH